MAQQVVIAGGGIIGASSAYYLAQKGLNPIVVEAGKVAGAASGKAGGFLALDWCDGNELGPLARTSFALHAELAKTLPQDVGYRRCKTHSIAIKTGSRPSTRKIKTLPAWVDAKDAVSASVIGNEGNTGQVHPEKLTKALLEEVVKKGGAVREHTEIVGLKMNPETRAIEGVYIKDRSIGPGADSSNSNYKDREGKIDFLPADHVVLAMGVWSSSLHSILATTTNSSSTSTLNTSFFSGLKVHSLVLADPEIQTSADALFLAYKGNSGGALEPEVYPRPDGTVYVCGVSSEEAPPQYADQVKPEAAAIETLKEVATAVSSSFKDAEIVKEQACFLPCTDDGLPLIGKLSSSGVDTGLYIATGHSCWGILNGPATGLGIAELIVDGKAMSVDLTAFDPSRYSM
jgi:glycine/D-amino acid oxidase-like deaminating enzyme